MTAYPPSTNGWSGMESSRMGKGLFQYPEDGEKQAGPFRASGMKALMKKNDLDECVGE